LSLIERHAGNWLAGQVEQTVAPESRLRDFLGPQPEETFRVPEFSATIAPVLNETVELFVTDRIPADAEGRDI
jgi:hypothetical protein